MYPTSSNQPPRRLNDGSDSSQSYKMDKNKETMSMTKKDTTINNRSDDLIKKKRKRPRRRTRKSRYGNTNIQLPAEFQPTENAVLCGRSRHSFDWEGNKRLRQLVKTFVDDYVKATEKEEKSNIVSNIVQEVRSRSPEGAFVKQINGQWFEVGDAYAREKVGAQFRNVLHTQYRSSVKSKLARKQKKKEEEQRQQEGEHAPKKPSLQLLEQSGELPSTTRLIHFGSFDRVNSFSSFNSSSSGGDEESSSKGTENLANSAATAAAATASVCQIGLGLISVADTDLRTTSSTNETLGTYRNPFDQVPFYHTATDVLGREGTRNISLLQSARHEPSSLSTSIYPNDDEVLMSQLLRTNSLASPNVNTLNDNTSGRSNIGGSGTDTDLEIIDRQLIDEVAPSLESIPAALASLDQGLYLMDFEDQNSMTFDGQQKGHTST